MRLVRAFGFFALTALIGLPSLAQDRSADALGKFNTMLSIISQTYVDSVNEMELVDNAIIQMLEELDPHSVYISKEDKQKMNEPLVGNFEGVGIQFNIIRDTILVVSPIVGGPSEKLGILAGDKIITIEGDTVAGVGFTNSDVVKNLRGAKGTIVNVGIFRNGEEGLLDFRIKRDKIPIYSVDEGYMINESTGYVRVTRFARNSTQELIDQMKKLESEGMENLILDLRGNRGGYLSTAQSMADQFIDGNKLLVYTQGRAFPRSDLNAKPGGYFKSGKLVVLVDEGSASASEIVSGAVQDWDRGLIIGRRTFGKGLVQKPFGLPDGSEVRMTIQRYYTPSGRCIQRPYGEGTKEYYKDLQERFKDGELTNQDSIDFPDSLKFETRINKRTVYGGGGIMPDIFVPADTSGRSDYYLQLLRKGVFNQFSLTYLDKQRDQLKAQFPDKYSFVKDFEVGQDLIDQLVAFGEKEGVEFNEEQYQTSEKQIKNLLKAYFGRGLFNSGVYIQVLNQNDPTIKRAVTAMEDRTFKNLKLKYK